MSSQRGRAPHPRPRIGAFQARVCVAIRRLRPGEVATYGEIAREAGYPGAARAVGHLLARGEHDLPWWRVVTSTGRLVPGEERRHAAMLRAEGVAVHAGRVERRAAGSGLRPSGIIR